MRGVLSLLRAMLRESLPLRGPANVDLDSAHFYFGVLPCGNPKMHDRGIKSNRVIERRMKLTLLQTDGS